MTNANIFLPIILAVAANTFYQIASKGIPQDQNVFMGLIVNYAVALFSCVALFLFSNNNSVAAEISKTNWACVLMGLSITAVEFAFVIIYRLGGEVSTAALIVSILLAVALMIVGIIFYGENLSAQKIIGAILCIAGIIVISL